MSPPSQAPVPMDPFFGRKDICFHIEKTVKSLFPSNKSTSKSKSKSSFYSTKNSSHSASSSQDTLVDDAPGMDLEYDLPPMREWLAYVLYRTALPDATVFHALHLLRRVASTSSSSRSRNNHHSTTALTSPLFSTSQPLGHYALIITALLLATDYNMDDAYSTASWCIASKDLFLLKEMNSMQLDMLGCLGWRMRAEGEDDLGAILKEDEEEYLEELAREEEERQRKVEEEEKAQLKRATSLGKRLGSFLNPHHSSSSRSPSVSPERSISRPKAERRSSKGFFERTKTQDLSLHRTISNRA